MKKIIAAVMALVLVLTLASCGISSSEQQALSSKLDSISAQLDTILETIGTNGGGSGEVVDNVGGEDVTDVAGEDVTDVFGEDLTNASGETPTNKTPSNQTTKKSDSSDPSKWTTQQIVDYYKKAASVSKGKSAQTMTITSLPGILSPLKSLFNSTLQKNSQPFSGITGGYAKLTASDLKSASAKKSGNYIIINMVPKTQVDDAYGKATEGTTGHLISVLDGIAMAVDALGLSAEYPDGSVKLTYKNGFAKNIKINTKTGVIESGSWGYDLDIALNGCKLSVFTLKDVNGTVLYRVSYPA